MSWRFSLFLVLMFALLVAFSLAPWEGFLCKHPVIVDLLSHKDKDGVIGCFEFWFNRYQTLIGTIAAVGAAAAAWSASQGQISAARHQAEIGRQQYAAAALPVLEKILLDMNEADASIYKLKMSLWALRHKIIAAKLTLKTAYEADGDAIGHKFATAISKVYRSNEEFEKAEGNFNVAYEEAVAAGNRMRVNNTIFREHVDFCVEMSDIKSNYINEFLDFDQVYENCRDGDTDIAENLWIEISASNSLAEINFPSRPLLKEAQTQTSMKIESIVNSLVS